MIDIKNHTILVVDDEKMILNTLKRVLNSSLHCEVLTAESGIEALSILKTKKCTAVISDMAMPGMNGAELLNTIQELYPDTIRLMFTARGDASSFLRAVGSTHQYFLKPSSISVLSDRISTMLQFRTLLPQEGIDDVISRLGSLPSIPEVYREMDLELQKKNVEMEAIGGILEKDLAMSVKVLQLVNSAFFGLREKISRPSQAIPLLGLNTIRSLFLGLHLFGEWKKNNSSGVSPQDLWLHSTNVASAAMDIARHMGYSTEKAGEVYCAGLFHDLGKLVISSNLPLTFTQIENLHKTGISWDDAEQEILGASHSVIGGYLLALWGFPVNTVKAIAFHHEPEKSGDNTFSATIAVHVANCFRREGMKESSPPSLNIAYLNEIGLIEPLKEWKNLLSA